MSEAASMLKVGVFVDVANIYMNGGQKMQYDVLRAFSCRDGAEPLRLNAYVTYDAMRAEEDEEYRKGALNFHFALRDLGYKVIVKEIQWYYDDGAIASPKQMSIWIWRWMHCCRRIISTGCC